jgi:hypothetical protein
VLFFPRVSKPRLETQNTHAVAAIIQSVRTRCKRTNGPKFGLFRGMFRADPCQCDTFWRQSASTCAGFGSNRLFLGSMVIWNTPGDHLHYRERQLPGGRLRGAGWTERWLLDSTTAAPTHPCLPAFLSPGPLRHGKGVFPFAKVPVGAHGVRLANEGAQLCAATPRARGKAGKGASRRSDRHVLQRRPSSIYPCQPSTREPYRWGTQRSAVRVLHALLAVNIRLSAG